MIREWNTIVEKIIFDFPAKFTDLYLLALVIQKVKSDTDCTVVCGSAHAENLITKLRKMYKITHLIFETQLIQDDESNIKILDFREKKNIPVLPHDGFYF